MAFYDARENVRVDVKCGECGHEERLTLELGINLEAATIKSIDVENIK